MPRTRSPDSLGELVDAAAEAFIADGYARTQVEDVAARLGVAKGTIYGYVTSKQALFALVVGFADRREPLPGLDQLPLDIADLPEPAAVVKQRLESELDGMVLLSVLNDPGPDAGNEVEGIVSDLLVRMRRHRVAIKIVDRCAAEFPALAQIWFEGGRWGQVQALADYLRSRADAKRMEIPGDATVVARSVIELCALWAVHMRWDPAPRPVDDEVVLATIPAMVRALLTRGIETRDGEAERPRYG
ncbi:MAG: TetR/AcrR family transcriptional regulator [Nitriliruptorales bacterium]|nr:TetR/AcrR family transcriptional regulator [Nitriliruptorales bacterium]